MLVGCTERTVPDRSGPAEEAPPAPRDRAILARLQANDEPTWRSVVAEHGPRLRRIGHSYRLGAQEVEDALQGTWMSLLTHAGQVRDPACLGAWLATSMRHECLRLLRRAGRKREHLVEDWGPYESGDPEAVDASAAIGRDDVAAELWRLVGRLPARQRELIRLLYQAEQPSYADVSVRLDMPVGAIGPTRQRALRHLRALVDVDVVLPA